MKQDVSLSKCSVSQDLRTTFILGSAWSVIELIIYIYMYIYIYIDLPIDDFHKSAVALSDF